MKQSSARFMIRIGCYLLILLSVIATVLMVFFSQLDLNDYRLSLEQRLSSALEQPVKIGHSSLTLNQGLALALENLQIGPDDAPFAIIPHMTATLKIAPLFNRQLILDQIQIDNPKLQLWLPFPERPAKGTSQRLIDTLGIRILGVHNGSIVIFQRQKNDAVVQRLALANLHAVLTGWKPGETGQLVVSGKLPEQGTDFLFETRLPSSRNPEIWRQEEFDSKLKITNFPTRKFIKTTCQNLPEALDLNLSLQGIPATGTILNANLTSPDKRQPILALSGCWISSKQQETITELQGKLFDIPLTGKFHLLRQAEKLSLTGKVEVQNIALTPELLQKWKIPNTNKFIGGQLEQLAFSLHKSWSHTDNFASLPHIEAELVISDIEWDLPEFNQLHDFSVKLSLNDKTLSIKKGILTGGNRSLLFSGKIDSLFLQPQLDLELNFNAQVADFASKLNLPDNWHVSGNLPGSLNLSGSLFDPTFILQADLSSIKAQMGVVFQKKATDNAKIFLRGQLDNTHFQLEELAFNLNDFKLSASGYFQPGKNQPQYHLSAAPIELAALQPFSPLLRRIKLTGTIEPELTTGMQGTAKIRNGGAHIISLISDLKNTAGEISFDRHGFSFKELKTSLGKSPFIVDGSFSNWRNPLLILDINSKKARAQDLVFSNRQLTLYDLTGQLLIDANSISFSTIKVRLEDDTVATVNGKVGFENPVVNLDISAEQVDVLDIINLFGGRGAKAIPKTNAKGPPLHIKIAAQQGTLGRLKFQNATGLISGEGGRLTVYPLRFESGTGGCKTRVEFNYANEIAPLKISGHTENIDASALYHQIFQEHGLVSGLLTGDFYIEGNPKNNQFWQHAKGGVYAQISNGTLRKFHGLAKVFSLLNISQIFAGKLPDMDEEGMPFCLLETSVQIGGGKVTTQNLKITSEAMNLSVVGTHNLIDDNMDFTLGVMPLRTVDKIVTSIPIAGWVLAGENKALFTAHFKLEGASKSPEVTAIPIDSVSETVFGIFKRTLGLPGKLIKDVGSILQNEPEKKEEP